VINETRERFLKAIVERIPAERIVEVHFFPGIRQGHVESGVAVIAALQESPAAPVSVDAPMVESHESADAFEPVEAAEAAEVAEPVVDEADADAEVVDVAAAGEPAEPAEAPASPRTEVHTATYRFTRKGPERGKWVVDVVAEAYAPLATVATVVKGVEERSGEGFETDHMSGDDVRAVLAAGSVSPLPTPEATAA
jgi:hypothetical protein